MLTIFIPDLKLLNSYSLQVGDCYVAVSGLPEPRKDHALVMSRVARDCVYKMSILTKRLEVMLGPDTAELNIRIGLNR